MQVLNDAQRQRLKPLITIAMVCYVLWMAFADLNAWTEQHKVTLAYLSFGALLITELCYLMLGSAKYMSYVINLVLRLIGLAVMPVALSLLSRALPHLWKAAMG